MKRTSLIAILLSLAFVLCACGTTEPAVLFDEVSEGIVSVILKDYNDGTIHYDVIGPSGQRQETQPFESDPLEILTVPDDCFETYIEHQPQNRLIPASLIDKSGNPAEITAPIQRIFELAAGQEQVIQSMRILRQGEHHFVTIEWNVNFWDPHVVFYYDPHSDTLTELCTYDATQVIGLKILNLQHRKGPEVENRALLPSDF